MELRHMTKSPKKKRDTQESFFSKELEKYLPLKDVLVLGHHLATELDFSGSCDTLGKWMAHHLAEIMERAENEKDTDKKSEYKNQMVELTLKIWEHRSSLKGEAYPLTRFKGIIQALSFLSPEANIWEKGRLGKYESLAADSYSMIVDLYRSLLFVEFSALKSVRSKQLPPSVLSDDEQAMYEILNTWAEEELNLRSIDDVPIKGLEVQVANERVCGFIDDLCGKLQELKGELSNLKSSSQDN